MNLNTKELFSVLNHFVKNNRSLQEKGITPQAINIEGEAGLGKTSAIGQFSKELNLQYVYLNLSMLEDLGDLVGYPVKQYQIYIEVLKENPKLQFIETMGQVDTIKKAKWVDEATLQTFINKGYKTTGKSRLAYAPPSWVSQKPGGILLLDDYSRANARFLQATMQLIDQQSYISWSLPKDWHIVLTSNPDNGEYMVNTMDHAQKTRMMTVNLKFDPKVWAEWAEGAGIDPRCINFLLLNPEIMDDENCNARSVTGFFNSISSIEDFEKNLPTIQILGAGWLSESVSTMFTLFINNKLDKLVDVSKLLLDPKDDILKELEKCIGSGDSYRADIASVLATRLANYALAYSKSNIINKKITDRLVKICTGEHFTNDLKYLIVRTIFNGNKSKFKQMMLNPEIIKMTMS